MAFQDASAQPAAVAVIVTDGADPLILLVRRRERAGDPWSGHVAFPGGFAAATDASSEVTAARETEEETGLPLGRVGTVVGRLDDVAPRSVFLPRITVTPVVFAVAGPLPVFAGPEVAECAWLETAELFDPANREPLEIPLPTGRRSFDSIRVRDFTIWGLTERILAQIPPLLAQTHPG